jgi:Zn-dependent peptidase ImmA (M78 family)
MALRRGFKAEAERTAASLREELGVSSEEFVDPKAIAMHYEVEVIDATELVPRERIAELEEIQAFAFSACTFRIDGATWIVINPLRTSARQASDIVHELGHVILDHPLSEIRNVDGVPFRTCRAEEEEEATYLGGALLLPRPLLLMEVRAGLTPKSVANKYGVSEDMARFRINTTGVQTQVARSLHQ